MNFDDDIVGWLDDIGWFACFDGAWLFPLRSWKTVNQVAAGAPRPQPGASLDNWEHL